MPKAVLGKNCNLGQNVFVADDVVLGDNVKVQNNVSIYTGVVCEEDVFLGPSMVFTNVTNPRSAVKRKDEYKKTFVGKGATIGANATIVCGISIGKYAFCFNFLSKIIIPSSVKNIGRLAFNGNDLKEVFLPSNNLVHPDNYSFVFGNIPESQWLNQTIGKPHRVEKSFSQKEWTIRGIKFNSPFDVQKVLNNISPYETRGNTIIISYNMNENNKIFDIDNQNNIFETLYKNKNHLLKNKPYFVYYNNSIKTQDNPIDDGGLTNNVFYLLSNFLKNKYSNYLTKSDDYYTISPSTNIDNNKMHFLGELFGFAIRQRLVIEIELHPLLLYQMINDDFNSIGYGKIISIINDFDSKLLQVHPYSCLKSNITDKDCDLDSELTRMPENTDDYTKRIEGVKKIKEYVFYSVEKSIKEFIDGFRKQINVVDSQLNMLPLKSFSQLICGSDIELTYENLMKYLQFENFNSVDKIDSIKNLIKSKIDSDSNWLKLFLFALTNKTKIPINGYEKNKLIILLNSYVSPPYVIHTCYNLMDLNKNTFDEYFNSTNKSETSLYTAFSSTVLKIAGKGIDLI
jgi:hypothetical protein